MTCPHELELSMYADRALDNDAAAGIEAHLQTCASCHATVSALRAETAWLSEVLGADEALLTVPALALPEEQPAAQAASHGLLASWGGLLLGVATSIAAAPALLEIALRPRFPWLGGALSWLDSTLGGGLAEIAARFTLSIVKNGDDIMKLITETVAAIAIVGFIAWIAAAFGRRRTGPLALSLSLAVFAVTLMPAPADALEIRDPEDGTVFVGADETIDDTLMAFGQTIEIDGNVLGDLFAFGQSVVIRGSIEGNLITAAQTVTISGDIGGTVIGAGQTVNVSSAQIGRNLFGFGNVVNAADTTSIEQNAMVFSGQVANMAGPIGRDLYSFGTQVEIGSEIGGNLRTFGPNVSILGPARIGGDFEANTPNENGLSISPGATIVGEQTVNLSAAPEQQNKYANPGWYGSQLLRFVTAFITGLVILMLVPGLRGVAITGIGNGFATAGIGLVALVATPLIALLSLIIVIGAPLGVFTVFLYLASLYLSKIVLAFFVARKFFESRGNPRHFALTLAAGLAMLIIVINLPYIGGILNFVFMIAGLGLIVMFLFAQIRKLSAPKEATA